MRELIWGNVVGDLHPCFWGIRRLLCWRVDVCGGLVIFPGDYFLPNQQSATTASESRVRINSNYSVSLATLKLDSTDCEIVCSKICKRVQNRSRFLVPLKTVGGGYIRHSNLRMTQLRNRAERCYGRLKIHQRTLGGLKNYLIFGRKEVSGQVDICCEYTQTTWQDSYLNTSCHSWEWTRLDLYNTVPTLDWDKLKVSLSEFSKTLPRYLKEMWLLHTSQAARALLPSLVSHNKRFISLIRT